MALRKLLSELTNHLSGRGTEAGTRSNQAIGGASSVAFATAVVALGAKMARADGVVVPIETAAFHQVFKTDAAERANVDYVFRLAQADLAGFESYARQVASLLKDDRPMLREVLASLFYVASADRLLHPKEDSFLREIATIFGLTESEWRYIRAQVVEDNSSPYDVLGLTPDDDKATIAARYRKLVKEYHPDGLIGRGMPESMIVVANHQMAAITAAYKAIAEERGL